MTNKRILTLRLSPDELHMILQALGQHPYNQVSELIHHIQGEVGPQLVEAKNTLKQCNLNPGGDDT